MINYQHYQTLALQTVTFEIKSLPKSLFQEFKGRLQVTSYFFLCQKDQ